MIKVQLPSAFDGIVLRQQMKDAGLSVKDDPVDPKPDFFIVGDTLQFPLLEENEQELIESLLTEHEALANAEAGRSETASTNRRSIEESLANAMAQNQADRTENDAFLAKTAPTPNEVDRQIKALTRQSTRQARYINMLIRIQQGRFESTE
jgi:hypothetical protein